MEEDMEIDEGLNTSTIENTPYVGHIELDSKGGRDASGRLKESKKSMTAGDSAPAHLGEILGITNPTVTQSVMISIIEDPIQCGFLLAFCESEHSTENVSFVMEVVRFREALSSDKSSWPYTWQEVDEMLLKRNQQETTESLSRQSRQAKSTPLSSIGRSNNFSISSSTTTVAVEEEPEDFASTLAPVSTKSMLDFSDSAEGDQIEFKKEQQDAWPSSRLKQFAVEELVQNIWDTYLSNHAESQICMPSVVVTSTRARIQNLHLYGPEVFGQCLLDPIKTLQRDILPRFLGSPIFENMTSRLKQLQDLPFAAALSVPPPVDTLLNTKELDYFTDKRVFTLDDILHDKFLYVEFLNHLKKSVQSENLLCVRMIEVFESQIGDNDSTYISQAWTIYRYFVAPGSAYEVSLYSRHKKELMLLLARPQTDMFDELKKSALNMLSVNFNNYRFTSDYRDLYKMMREKRKEFSKPEEGRKLRLPTVPNIGAFFRRSTEAK